jgi:hypothetical protein
VILQLKAMGIDNVLQFDFMSPPPATSMVRALEQLFALGMGVFLFFLVFFPLSFYCFSLCPSHVQARWTRRRS